MKRRGRRRREIKAASASRPAAASVPGSNFESSLGSVFFSSNRTSFGAKKGRQEELDTGVEVGMSDKRKKKRREEERTNLVFLLFLIWDFFSFHSVVKSG